MATAEQRPVTLKSGDATRDGTLHVSVLTQRERTIRAAKIWGLCWGLALVTLFIPIAHFVLVPGFFIAGPVMGYLRYRMAAVPERVTGVCPTNHEEEISIPVEATVKFPLWTYCPKCNASVLVVDKAAVTVG